MTALETVSAPVGVRHSHEVSEVLAVASAVPFCTERFGRGVLGALRWVLGHQVAAPITAASSGGVPPWAQLLDEAYAAREELLGRDGRTVELDYAHGVYESLAWVCGHHEHPPVNTAGH
ncbi:hypothetical protein KNE206_30810 [Kitasatospora sp. NE20-6]|uniref:hypothetical protein n=1 Tax=Kitasatospora sp. NE20-6 TaxID=2859066 RepID=UPI0034DBE1B4